MHAYQHVCMRVCACVCIGVSAVRRSPRLAALASTLCVYLACACVVMYVRAHARVFCVLCMCVCVYSVCVCGLCVQYFLLAHTYTCFLSALVHKLTFSLLSFSLYLALYISIWMCICVCRVSRVRPLFPASTLHSLFYNDSSVCSLSAYLST